ncbi:protein kinase family protein [Nonomuraea maheshkhaliensis]|uniref:protein kinase family protein n=1 Tax=Nonomuraea maheshkhaliensis TaxID=419590 RepID=UPI0031F84C96
MPGDPERLGGFWPAARLGAGKRGVVYDAYDDEGRRYAVTVPRGEVGHRFEKVTCRQLAQVVAVGSDRGVPYVVSQFVSGPDLREAVGLHGPYCGDELVALAAALAAALRALHEAGLTHSGLNPEAVLLAADGPRVIELGLPASDPAGDTCTYLAPEVLTGQPAEAAADVFAWGAVVLFAATGRDPFQGESLGGIMHRLLTVDPDLSCLPDNLRELVGRALSKNCADRPAAAELLIDSETELRPPEAWAPTRSLGEVAEEAYLSLTPRQQEEVPGLLLRLLDGDDPHDEGEVLAPLMEAGLLVRRSVRVPPAETAVGKLVAVSDNRVAAASAALYRAWPRLRGWVADERDGMPSHRRIREAARTWSEHRRDTSHLFRGHELDSALGWAATKRRHVRLNQLERDFINDSVALSKQRRKLMMPALATVAAVLAVAVTMSVLSVHGQNDLRERLIEADARAVAARAENLRDSDPRTAMRLSVAAWRLAPVFEARAALQASLVQPELGVFTDPGADARARYLLRGDELVRWDADAVTVWDVAGGRRTATYVLPPGSTALSDDGRYAEGPGGRPFDVATGQAPAGDAAYAISRGNRTVVRRGGRMLFDVSDKKVALSPDGSRAAVSGVTGRVELWDLTPRRVRTGIVTVQPLTGVDAGAPALAFSPDGGTLAVAGRDGVTLVEDEQTRTARSAPAQPLNAQAPPQSSPTGPMGGEAGHPGTLAAPPTSPPAGQAPLTGALEAQAGRPGVLAASPTGPVGAQAAPSGTLPTGPLEAQAGPPGALAAPSPAEVEAAPSGALAARGVPSGVSWPGLRALPAPEPAVTLKAVTPSALPERDTGGQPAGPKTDAGGQPALPERDGGAQPAVPKADAGGRSAAPEIDAGGSSASPEPDAWASSGARKRDLGEGPVKERGWGVEIVDGLETPPGALAGPLVFSPDGRLLALPGDGEVRVWNVAERRLAGAYPLKDPGHGLTFSKDGRTLRYLSGTGSVVSLDVSGLPMPAQDGQVAAFSGNGRVAAKEVGDTIELTDTEARRTLGRIAAAGDLAFDASGRLLAVAGDPVTVWEVTGGRRVAAINAGGDVPAVALSPDGGTLATARGSTLETWDVRQGQRIKTYESAGDLALAFSPDGRTLAAGDSLLDLRTGRITPLSLAAEAGGGAAATALAFSPGGDRLAFGLEGGRVLLWDVRERRPLGTIETGTTPVDELRFSPKGDLLAIDGGRTSLWDTKTLREVGQVGSWASGLAFSQDGRRLRGVALDGTVHEIAVDPALTASEVCARAGGALSRQEWARLIPESGYQDAC